MELEDLLEDTRAVEARYRERFARRGDHELCFLENEAPLSGGKESLRESLISIDGMNIARYKNVNEIIEDLDAVVREFIVHKEYPASVRRLPRRKMDKVLSYIAPDDAP